MNSGLLCFFVSQHLTVFTLRGGFLLAVPAWITLIWLTVRSEWEGAKSVEQTMTDFAALHHLHFDDIKVTHNRSQSATWRPQTNVAAEQISLCSTPGRNASTMSSNRIPNVCAYRASLLCFAALMLIYLPSMWTHRCCMSLRKCFRTPNSACLLYRTSVWGRTPALPKPGPTPEQFTDMLVCF